MRYFFSRLNRSLVNVFSSSPFSRLPRHPRDGLPLYRIRLGQVLGIYLFFGRGGVGGKYLTRRRYLTTVRLDSYSRNLIDHHLILDLVPALAQAFFRNRIPVHLSFTQAALLLGVGLQHKTIENMEVRSFEASSILNIICRLN